VSKHLKGLLSCKRVLLLQGPMGNFFSKFSQWLVQHKIDCLKLNFNGGDSFFSKNIKNTFDYTDTLENFENWLTHFIKEYNIDAIVCFGDCRFYHVIAKNVSKQCQIKFYAFEEGYIRPNYITFEQDGVNFYSNFNDAFTVGYLDQSKSVIQPAVEVNNRFSLMTLSAILYYWFWVMRSSKYPNYQHHRQIAPRLELYYWWRSAYRRLRNRIFEKRRFKLFLRQYSKQYFIFSLQVHNDSQILTHSHLKSVELYIEKVIESFGQYANKNQHLVLKHHPMDRGYKDYSKLIHEYMMKFNLEGRIHYFCDIHFPSLLKHSLGMVTVNSTTGLQALFHGIPVKTIGYAIYNLPGLTNQYPLQKFWLEPGEVDMAYFYYFRQKLIDYSQLNGSFYGKSPWMSETESIEDEK